MKKVPSAANSTRWSLIVRAQGTGTETRAALGELIGHYEKFVVWLIRHHGHPPDTHPEELKQEFLEGVLRRNDIAKLDRARGSFRGWLDVAVRRFLLNEWDKWRAVGSGRRVTSPGELAALDQVVAPDASIEREFACHVVAHALSLQRAEARDPERFDALARFLPGPQMDLVELEPLAGALGMTKNALAKSVCVMRMRYRQLLREAVHDLLDLDGDIDQHPDGRAIDDELRDLRRHFWS